MPLKLFLESAGPGRGLLHVEGSSEPVESVSLAIQRNNGRYLGLDGDWQPAPYWHPQFGAEPDPRGLRIELGPTLMNGIIAMHGAPLMLSLRIDGEEDRGVVRVRGTLVGSDAAAPGPEEPTRILGRTDQPLSQPAVEQSESVPGADAQDSPEHRRSGWPLPLLLTVALVLLLAAAAVWYFDMPGRFLAGVASGTGSATAPNEPSDGLADVLPEHPSAPASTFAPSPESALTGLQFVVEYLTDEPSAAAMLAEAESRSEAGDCDAALLLYARAAEHDPALSLPVARLFDSETYADGGCIDAANEATALEYYRSAAEAGLPAAMRRAGEILTARATSGPLHEEGVEWLRRAASAPADQDLQR